MQRIIQINIAGRVLPIEEDAYQLLKDYINSLERQFRGDEGAEIIEDIENRIAELFSIRLQGGAPAIDRNDVRMVTDTLGAASDLTDNGPAYSRQHTGNNNHNSQSSYQQQYKRNDRLLRNPYDKVLGGVCSGLARYFDIDPVIIRLIMVVLFLTFGIGLIAYLIAWAIIPAARSREELNNMNDGQPMTFHDISRNMQGELDDLKKRGEQMSRELKEFFSKRT
jgi:phage shock protein PspC (stress-responsive transcriptional regulator)